MHCKEKNEYLKMEATKVRDKKKNVGECRYRFRTIWGKKLGKQRRILKSLFLEKEIEEEENIYLLSYFGM